MKLTTTWNGDNEGKGLAENYLWIGGLPLAWLNSVNSMVVAETISEILWNGRCDAETASGAFVPGLCDGPRRTPFLDRFGVKAVGSKYTLPRGTGLP